MTAAGTVNSALTTLARRELGPGVLVAVLPTEHGETLQLVGPYGPYAAAPIGVARMLEWSGSICALRREVLSELLLTSQLGDVEERLGYHDGGT